MQWVTIGALLEIVLTKKLKWFFVRKVLISVMNMSANAVYIQIWHQSYPAQDIFPSESSLSDCNQPLQIWSWPTQPLPACNNSHHVWIATARSDHLLSSVAFICHLMSLFFFTCHLLSSVISTCHLVSSIFFTCHLQTSIFLPVICCYQLFFFMSSAVINFLWLSSAVINCRYL